ncbi:1777_t:CDS:2 [Funneliformis geosporum]|uniref:18042_t:CDS:1 n=1 Tax=Funneliformis geosporum TaxID=1117311 RepID=A0A9W4SJY4_9GLOM|nr:18042_t:CDS:2 [Funneliformis geosporum]CAI2177719.1 1777_t:CDS:2 [Funneliformis geosporum]
MSTTADRYREKFNILKERNLIGNKRLKTENEEYKQLIQITKVNICDDAEYVQDLDTNFSRISDIMAILMNSLKKYNAPNNDVRGWAKLIGAFDEKTASEKVNFRSQDEEYISQLEIILDEIQMSTDDFEKLYKMKNESNVEFHDQNHKMSKVSDDLDIDKYLSTEATQLQKDQEVERILSAFKLNPFDLLDLSPYCTEKDIKNAYRRKSLLIHPDKTSHPKAQEAFSLLKKAKITLINEQKLKPNDSIINTPEFNLQIKQKTKEILIEQELRRRKLLKRDLEAQGLAAQKAEQVEKERKRKAEEDKLWEETREQRVNNWRDFQTKKNSSNSSGSSAKKKKKSGNEFKPPKVLAEDPTKPYIKRPTNS